MAGNLSKDQHGTEDDMRRSGWKIFSAFILVAVVLSLVPITAYAASPSDVIIGNSYTLEDGQTLNDNLFVFGGTVDLMDGSTVKGDIYLLGGTLSAAGTVTGNMTVLGGTLNLAKTFVLNGDLTTAGTSVNRDPGAQINGQIQSGETIQYFVVPGGMRVPNITGSFDPLFRVAGFFLRLFLWALVAMVVAMFLPAYLTRISKAALIQPLISGGLGLITVIIVPIILILLAITICLIPVALLGALVLAIAWAYGLIALGSELGKRISGMFKREWHPAISAGLGTLILMTVLNSLEAIIPCVGWIPKVLIGFVALGAVLLTQFGTKEYFSTPSLPAGGPAGTTTG
jgi:hypothetical protein